MKSKILFPVDGSDYSLRVIQRWLVEHPDAGDSVLHLINVQLPLGKKMENCDNIDNLGAYYQLKGEEALHAVRSWLEEGGISYHHHILVGQPAEIICRFAADHGITQIVMNSHGRGGLLDRLLGSVAQEVRLRASVPVVIVRDNDKGMQLLGS